MKIKIEISNDQLDVLNEELSIVSCLATTRNSKVLKSILEPLAYMFVRTRTKPVQNGKKRKISLTLYQGHYLEEFLKGRPSTDNDFRNSTIAKLIFEINQKLA